MTVNINISDELYQRAKLLAEACQIAVDEVFVSAFVEQQATLQRLEQRAGRGNRSKFLSVLDSVPDVPAEEFDQI